MSLAVLLTERVGCVPSRALGERPTLIPAPMAQAGAPFASLGTPEAPLLRRCLIVGLCRFGELREVSVVTELLGIARFKFHEGKVDEFKRLSARCMEVVLAQDTGTLQYDTYFNADQSEAVVIERYRDSQALIEHAEHLAEFMEPIIATGDVDGELLGDLSPELRAKMTGDVPQLFTLYQSM